MGSECVTDLAWIIFYLVSSLLKTYLQRRKVIEVYSATVCGYKFLNGRSHFLRDHKIEIEQSMRISFENASFATNEASYHMTLKAACRNSHQYSDACANVSRRPYQLSVSIILTVVLCFDVIFLLLMSLLHCCSRFPCIDVQNGSCAT